MQNKETQISPRKSDTASQGKGFVIYRLFPFAAMSILRIPDVAGAVFQMETRVHPDEVEVTQAMHEWFAR